MSSNSSSNDNGNGSSVSTKASAADKDDLIASILEHQEELLDCSRHGKLIVETMRRLPYDAVETLALERNLRFFSISDQFYAVSGTLTDPFAAVPPEERGIMPRIDWHLVMLNDMEMRKLRSKEDKESVIAHELAHIYLNHKVFDSKDIEQEADDLIKSWGFNPKIGTKHKKRRQQQKQLEDEAEE